MKIKLLAGCFAAVLVVMVLGQRSCDRAGYWPRREETRVYAAGWSGGEERKCAALPREDGTIFFLGCANSIQNFDDAPLTTVTFWGKTERPDRFQALHSNAMEGWHWRCKKSDASITCYAIN